MQKCLGVLVIPFLLVVLYGCVETSEKFVVSDEFIKTENAITLKKELEAEKNVEKAIAIFVDEHLLIAVQLNPWQKWQKAKIEEKLQKKYEEQYHNYDVLVSSDYKIYLELAKMNEKQDGELNEKIKELKELAKEET